MIFIVNGRRYNTITSECIKTFSNGYKQTNLNYYEETLYKTQKGNYFLRGRGGAHTRFAFKNGERFVFGEKTLPLTREEALAWCENAMVDNPTAERLFGDIIEDA